MQTSCARGHRRFQGSYELFGLILLSLLTGNTFAAKCSINTSPNTATISVGESVRFDGSVSGKSPKTYFWTFNGGNPASSNLSSVSVEYPSAGNYGATLEGTDGRGGTCSASVTVQVNAAGNARPAAQNDDYNTQEGVTLTIPAPGILGNDSDPEGDPMTAVLVSNVPPGEGTLSLASDGGFIYTPDDFTGPTSFSYTANDAGGASNVATVVIGVAAANAVSINSTGANGVLPEAPVSEFPPLSSPNYTLVAINDLGMHCGDLDTRISSILPPFNVLHAQVIQRGINGLPQILGEHDAELFYSAASNPDDPAIGKSVPDQALSSVVNGEVYKTNFWDIAFGAYDAFYPDNVLDLFYDSEDPLLNIDKGLPVPDVERFYLGDGELHASQQFMPGILAPYAENNLQGFHEHIGTLPFFINFPFGYTASPNFFEAPGIPIAAFDDFGRENPYPLMKVEAHVGGNPVASLDTVVPISGEAECQVCHADGADGGNGLGIKKLGDDVATSLDDPSADVPGAISVEWASDKNILKLHDIKHATTLITGTTEDFPALGATPFKPVVCQTCHYTPALDLAQLGPLGPGNDFGADFVNSEVPGGIISSPSVANGRDQLKHKSMSNAMHGHHGALDNEGRSPGDAGYNANNLLFATMPPAIDGQGNRRDPILTQTILEETCYSCHPGKRTQCMRGAMANGGLVCQDCHGQMAQVGDDFTRDVSPNNPGPGAFHLAADFYDNPATPRVPWANEPGCGSCHTGYATDNLAGAAGTLVNPADTLGNSDGIRLLSAYLQSDSKATPIVPSNNAFAENVVTVDDVDLNGPNANAVGNPKLYRISTGHGGLFCQSCHGSTHAEWPTANPNANDNVASNQLQGHSGYIAECQVCHDPTDESLPLGNNGPHGMHPVADLEPNLGVNGVDNGTEFIPDNRWNLRHKNYRNDGPGCQSCHGEDLRGTVLSRTADERTVTCKDNKGSLPGCAAGNETAIIPKGTPVSCGMCHRQKR